MKPLKRISIDKLFHVFDGVKKAGPSSGLRGDCSGLWGNCSEIPADKRPCDISEWVEG